MEENLKMAEQADEAKRKAEIKAKQEVKEKEKRFNEHGKSIYLFQIQKLFLTNLYC